MPSPRLVAASLSLAVACAAQAAPRPSETDFDTGLAAVHAQMQKAKWGEARAALLELLRVHNNQIYAQAQCDAIVSDWRTCAFYATAKVPKLTTLITGKIASYDERSGRIKVVYEGSFKDWKRENDDELRV
ncbi:MAG TPA: hypothetical protein VFT55_00100, partial [Planctomycetota bacterium]|nr:hypothetical protein [Planctomycetota bacterium]